MVKAQPLDKVSIILPAAGAQLSDKNKLVDKVDDLSDTVDHYKAMRDNITFEDIPNLLAASGDLADRLRDIRGEKPGARPVRPLPSRSLTTRYRLPLLLKLTALPMAPAISPSMISTCYRESQMRRHFRLLRTS